MNLTFDDKSALIQINQAVKNSLTDRYTIISSTEPPGQVSDLRTTSIGLTEIALSWSKPKQPNGRRLSYFITYRGFGQQEEMITKEIPGASESSFQYKLSGLKFDTLYRIKVEFSVSLCPSLSLSFSLSSTYTYSLTHSLILILYLSNYVSHSYSHPLPLSFSLNLILLSLLPLRHCPLSFSFLLFIDILVEMGIPPTHTL